MEVVKKFIENHLPNNLKELIQLETLELEPTSYVDEHLKGYLADLVYSVKFGENSGYIYILFEHLSNPDEMIAFRLLQYMIRIMQSHLDRYKTKQLPIVYPIILYTGHNPYNYSTDLLDCFGNERELAESILLKPYQLIDIKYISDEEIKNQLEFGLFVKLFRYQLDEIKQLIKKLEPNLIEIYTKGDSNFSNAVIEYLFETREINGNDKKQYLKKLSENLKTQRGEEVMTTIADYLRQEGREEGILQGMQQGMQQGVQQGMQQGKDQGRIEALEQMAMALLLDKEPIDRIVKITGLSRGKIEELKRRKIN